MQIIPRWLYVMLAAVAFVTTSCHAIEPVPSTPLSVPATPVLIPTAIIQQTSTISATANLLPTVMPTPIPTTTVSATAANVLPAPLYFLGEDQQIWRLSGNDFTYSQLTAESQPIIDFDVSPIAGSLIYLVKENVPTQQEVPTQLIMTDAWGHNRAILAEVTESSTIRWSPDGKQYAYDGPEGIYIASPGSTPALRIPLKHQIDFERFTVESWSPDGRSLLVYQWGGGPGWNSYVFNIEDETMVGLAGGCCTPTWRYDSSGLYFAIAGLGEVYPGLWFVSATTGESSPMVQPLQSTGDLLPWAAYPYSNKDFLRAFIGTEPPAAGWPYFLTMVQINDADTLSPLRLDEHQVQEVLWSTDGSGAVMVGYPETKAELPNGEISWLVADDQPPVKLGVRGHDLRWGSTATDHSLSIPTPTPAFSQTNAPATD